MGGVRLMWYEDHGDLYHRASGRFVLHVLLVGLRCVRQWQVRAQALLLHSPFGRRRRGGALCERWRREEGRRTARGLVLPFTTKGHAPPFCRVCSPLSPSVDPTGSANT